MMVGPPPFNFKVVNAVEGVYYIPVQLIFFSLERPNRQMRSCEKRYIELCSSA
jgi:hypothetical protein